MTTNSFISEARQESPEVLYADTLDVFLRSKNLVELCEMARSTPRGRLRLCLHPCIDHPLHEMIIVHPRNAYVPPHKHHGQTESILMLLGDMELVIFDDQGEVSAVVPMGAPGGQRAFHHRMGLPQFHSMLISSEQVVFLETKTGPYVPRETERAPWAPDLEEGAAVEDYFGKIIRRHRDHS